MALGRLVCAVLGLMAAARPTEAYSGLRQRFPPSMFQNRQANDDTYDQYAAPVQAQQQQPVFMQTSQQVAQPAGIDRDENGVVGDFPGENGFQQGGAPTLLTPGGDAAADALKPAVIETPPAAPAAPTTSIPEPASASGDTVAPETKEGGAGGAAAGGAAPAPSKLELALSAIKEDIMKKSRQVGEELAWIEEVAKITQDYKEKSKRVEANVEVLRGDVKGLYKKKKQIENLILQKNLQAKLADANDDLGTLEKALGHVKSKEEEFVKTKGSIKETIDGINSQLSKLEGKTDPDLDEENSQSAIEEDIKSEI